jgi:hypothetical protein
LDFLNELKNLKQQAKNESAAHARASKRQSQEAEIEALINPVALEDAAPSSERVADLTVSKLDPCGNWQKRRVIVTPTSLLICQARRGVEREGVFMTRDENWLNKIGHRRTFSLRYFQMEDGAMKMWLDEEQMRKRNNPTGVINAMGSEITVVEEPEHMTHHRVKLFTWFLVDKGGGIHEFAHSSDQERQEWIAALTEHITTMEQDGVLDSIPFPEVESLSPMTRDIFAQDAGDVLWDYNKVSCTAQVVIDTSSQSQARPSKHVRVHRVRSKSAVAGSSRDILAGDGRSGQTDSLSASSRSLDLSAEEVQGSAVSMARDAMPHYVKQDIMPLPEGGHMKMRARGFKRRVSLLLPFAARYHVPHAIEDRKALAAALQIQAR